MRFSSETKKITGVELCEYSKGKNTTIDKKYIDALIAITKRTKNLLFMSCEVNFDNTNSFGLNLSDLAPDTTIFLTGDIVDIPSCDTNSPKRTRRWTVCDKHKNCGLSDINLTDNPYFGWKKYKSGALIGSYQNIKLSINGTPLTIPWKK
ncbi:MAG: hypothetical protein QM535_19685 [Limnohabitans sp.]|nr:hypothetical protein [Limnohabitans sp.]